MFFTYSNSPYHWEQDGSTAQQVHQEKDFFPQSILSCPLLCWLYDDVGHICQYLHTRHGYGLETAQGATTDGLPIQKKPSQELFCSSTSKSHMFSSILHKIYRNKTDGNLFLLIFRKQFFSYIVCWIYLISWDKKEQNVFIETQTGLCGTYSQQWKHAVLN